MKEKSEESEKSEDREIKKEEPEITLVEDIFGASQSLVNSSPNAL